MSSTTAPDAVKEGLGFHLTAEQEEIRKLKNGDS